MAFQRLSSREIERQAGAQKHSPEREQEAREWIESVLRESLPRGSSFQETFADGVLLCNLINVLRPGTVKKIHTGTMRFKWMENISQFLKGCKEFGLGNVDLFQSSDLVDGKNIPQVINTILTLARVYRTGGATNRISSSSSSSRSYQRDDYRTSSNDQQSRNYDYGSRSYDQQTSSYAQESHSYDQPTHSSVQESQPTSGNGDTPTNEEQAVSSQHDEKEGNQEWTQADHEDEAYNSDQEGSAADSDHEEQ